MAQEILIVDDEQDICRLIADCLADEGYQTRCATSGETAIEAVKSRCPNLVILDIWLGSSHFDGIRVLELIKKDFPDLPVVMMSGHGTIETAVSAIKKGAYDFIEKPFKMDRLLLVIERALEAAQLRRENEELKSRSFAEYDDSVSILVPQSIVSLINRIAPTNSRIMIQGPSGSGKGAVARLIHNRSKRSNGPFVILNCALLESDSIEAALFGIEEASGIKIGTLEKAHQGTLLLDEVADLSLEVQSKIVRVLQEQTFQRVNGHHKVQVDVRILSSTSHDIQALTQAGKFREDLFYRLNVVPLKMPSLKERLDELPQLVELFSEIVSRANGVPRRAFSQEALLALKTYDWPGNLRQLRNVIDWVLIMAQDEDYHQLIMPEMLPAEIMMRMPTVLQNNHAVDFISLPLKEARERFEKDYLLAQVSRFSGNISHTAHFVGMERSALHRKLKSLKIERSGS
jgi:two-component system nitrogen regulation response regulator NtrX